MLICRAVSVRALTARCTIGSMVTGIRYSAKQLGSRLDLHTLQIFLTAVEKGSLSEAAACEHLVVSAVSRRIADLERIVGIPLLERRHGGIVPTSAGRELADHAIELKRALKRIEEGLHAHRSGLCGEVHLHASSSSLLDRLPAEVAAFMALQPGVDVRVKELDSVRVVHNVLKGDAHIGVCSSYVSARGLQTLPYTKSPLVVVAPPGHPILKHASVSFEETLQYDQVILQDGDTFSALLLHMQSVASRLGIPMRSRVRVANIGVACRFVEAGTGIAIIQEASARLFAHALKLPIIMLSDEWAATRHDICIRNEASLPPAARHVFEYLKANSCAT